MSRSFRKVCNPICSSYGDKWCRSQYHRSFRRKTKKLLKECMSFHDLWSGEETPAERIIKKGKDYSLHYADKWSWSSDGGMHWREDKLSLYKAFNKEVLCESSDIWSDYIGYRDCKLNKQPKKWIIYYDMPDREVTEYHGRYDPEKECFYTVEETYMSYKRESKIVSHRPVKSDLPKDAVFRDFFVRHEGNYKIYWHDYTLIEFLFHRNMVPVTFNSREGLTNWLLKNENRIIESWYKVHSKK